MLRKPDFSGAGPGAPKSPLRKRRELSDEQQQELREAFDLFDSEQTGQIDYHELKVTGASAPSPAGGDARDAPYLPPSRFPSHPPLSAAPRPCAQVAMRALGFEVKKAEAQRLMEQHDLAQRGTIGYGEFLEIMTARILARDPHDELRKAFELFDEDSSGRITLRNMRRVARELGENLSDDELQAMIDEFDADQDGAISLAEFTSIMKSTTLYE